MQFVNVESPKADLQGSLFDDADLRPLPADIGYRGPIACAAAGITYRQLDYWARTELVQPSVRGATGSGTQRLYSFRDILVLRIVKRLIDTGVSLPNIRAAVDHLALRSHEDLARMTLMSDGATIYECRSADEVVDLVRGGQGVFGIAVGSVWREVEGTGVPSPPLLPAIRSRPESFPMLAHQFHRRWGRSPPSRGAFPMRSVCLRGCRGDLLLRRRRPPR